MTTVTARLASIFRPFRGQLNGKGNRFYCDTRSTCGPHVRNCRCTVKTNVAVIPLTSGRVDSRQIRLRLG
ncbi:hypothetical protein NDU88_007595 [Pleurodeles waltl]|uniref:Uncharacterized protein n=1 Tax=Pleurodeles waltl TaxID=8319 RepID=A0AAV7NBV7_PLEWA|nr:hypothetical protein NDU88_007595 [Pleurodeles waltl]